MEILVFSNQRDVEQHTSALSLDHKHLDIKSTYCLMKINTSSRLAVSLFYICCGVF